MAELIDTEGDEWGAYERISLGAALELDRVTDRGRNAASPAYAEGGMVARLARDLGTTEEELLAWGASERNER